MNFAVNSQTGSSLSDSTCVFHCRDLKKICDDVVKKGPSIKDVRKNLPFFDPPSPPRPGVSEINDYSPPPPPGRPHLKFFFAILTQILST